MRISVAAVGVVVALATSACSSAGSSCSAKQVPSQPYSRSVTGQPVVQSSRVATTGTSTTRSQTPLPRTFAALPAAPAASTSGHWNATCPVLVGNPVDSRITSSWGGYTIAFSSSTAKLMWDADPSRYAGNLPGASGSAAYAAARPVAVGEPARVLPPPSAARVLPPVAARTAPAPFLTARPAVVAKPMPAAVVAPTNVGSPDGEPSPADGECEDCPGGVCRVPGR